LEECFSFVEEIKNHRIDCTQYSYRWYYPDRALRWASENGERFRANIISLKDGKGSEMFFVSILWMLLKSGRLGGPDAVVSIPPHKKFESCPTYAMANIAKACQETSGAKGDCSRLLRRVITLPKGTRDDERQKLSMKVTDDRPDPLNEILLIDDVVTSGSTMRAGASLLREAYPSARISCFAFGRTQPTGSTRFPDFPKFPKPEDINTESIVQMWEPCGQPAGTEVQTAKQIVDQISIEDIDLEALFGGPKEPELDEDGG
jgi:hypothetical protein